MIELLLEAETALSLGLLDRAEILYRQVAGADPRNSIAVVGLARVMLERGDEAGALKQARRALTIDSENTAAQRMVERLEEVIAYRATTGGPPAAAARVTVAPAAAAPAAAAPVAAEPAGAVPAPTELPPASPTQAPADAGAPPLQPAAPAQPPDVPPSRSFVDRLLRRQR